MIAVHYCTLIRCTLVEKGVSGCKFAIPNHFFCMFLPCFWARSGPVMATSPKMIVNVRKTSPKDPTIRTIGCLGTTLFIICSDSEVSLLRSRPLTPPKLRRSGSAVIFFPAPGHVILLGLGSDPQVVTIRVEDGRSISKYHTSTWWFILSKQDNYIYI